MIASLSILLATAALSFASPMEVRAVNALNAARQEAQQQDNLAIIPRTVKVYSYATIQEVC